MLANELPPTFLVTSVVALAFLSELTYSIIRLKLESEIVTLPEVAASLTRGASTLDVGFSILSCVFKTGALAKS